MRNGTATIKALMVQVSQGQLRLPEIQRGYVWKPAQVAGLIDSLYRGYPSGSLLLWQTEEDVVDRALATTPPSGVSLASPAYLLDGQQRMTSLHRVYSGHERAMVVFNVATRRFQIESAATRKDRRWVRVHDLLSGSAKTFSLVQELAAIVPDVEQEELHARLERVKKIDDYTYWLEIIDDLPYPEVTEIFVRVNSRGRPLKETDLALATLSARWPGVVARFEGRIERSTKKHYPALDWAFLVRCLAALATETTSPGGFITVSVERLESAWKQLERGLDHTITLLQDEVEIDNSALLPSVNALVPLVYWLGTRTDTPLGEQERNALVYWLLVAVIQARYSSAAATVIAQDVAALRSPNPLEALCRNLGLLAHRPEVTPGVLAGKGSTSPYFLLSYLVARHRDARDWWFGVPVKLSHDGTYKVEYHHIHPQARLKNRYTKADINDLANLAFISDKANRKISARSPELYMSELDTADLTGHCVPTDPSLRTIERFPQLLEARREQLAGAMTDLLDGYRPAFLDDVATEPIAVDDTALSIQAYGATSGVGSVLVFTATGGGSTTHHVIAYEAIRDALNDLVDGRGTEIAIGNDLVGVASDTELLALPLAPLLVTGSVDDWHRVVDREIAELLPADELPEPPAGRRWKGPLTEFAVLDSD
jgi:hypothetical protein